MMQINKGRIDNERPLKALRMEEDLNSSVYVYACI